MVAQEPTWRCTAQVCWSALRYLGHQGFPGGNRRGAREGVEALARHLAKRLHFKKQTRIECSVFLGVFLLGIAAGIDNNLSRPQPGRDLISKARMHVPMKHQI